MEQSELKESLITLSKEISDWNCPKGSFYFKIETGGVNGGSCWDNSNPQPYSSDETIDISAKLLLPILLVIGERYPTLAFIQGIKLQTEIAKAIEEDDDTEYEYYGNRTNYNTYTLSIEKVLEICESVL